LKEYATVTVLKLGLGVYFHFYNDERPHQSFGKNTPTEVYVGLYKAVA
jgi:putative transposase